jgi:hypothetical protein
MRVVGRGHDVDTLLDLPAEQKVEEIDALYSIRIAYQTPITIRLPKTGVQAEALPNTFEDSLVLSNVERFAGKSHSDRRHDSTTGGSVVREAAYRRQG